MRLIPAAWKSRELVHENSQFNFAEHSGSLLQNYTLDAKIQRDDCHVTESKMDGHRMNVRVYFNVFSLIFKSGT